VSACLQCKEDFTPGPRRGARPQAYCTPKCQVRAANARRASTRSGRGSGALRTAKSVLDSSIDLPNLSTPPEAPTPHALSTATIAQLFGSWYVRVNGQLALGPLDQSRAQHHADRLNGVAK
jgi:hypothetical protein